MPRDYEAISRYNEEQLGKDRKSRMSQVAMYADTAHFVYELLQNADDAGAKEINFRLSVDALVVEHDGKPFDDNDVKAISYFGKGKTELTAIGHFGLGFKSVFAYTASPQVHSAEDNFEMVDLYTLRAIGRANDLKEGRTRFVLPFDHAAKKPVYIEVGKLKRADRARAEIGTKLKALGGATLLFTKSLREIQWTDGGTGGQYLREDSTLADKGRETLIVTGDANEQVFIVYEMPVFWPDDRGKRVERRPIAVAVQLDKSYRSGGRIAGEENQKLWVFFPTDKETHMGFIVQGPYRTTPARDNVPDNDDFNQHLVSETAKLFRRALNAMRKLGVVDAELLSRLPIDHTYFGQDAFLRPIYDQVRLCLQDDPVLPTSRGKYVPATKAKLARGAKLVDLIDDEQLSSLYGTDNLKWLDPVITVDRYPNLHGYLVGSKVHSWARDWKVEPLAEDMEVRVEDIGGKFTKEFMERQPDAWVIRFYKYLGENRGQNYWHFRAAPLIRLEGGQHVTPFKGGSHHPNAYLPTEADTNFPTVKRTLVEDPEVLEFLKETVELDLPDSTDEVLETILPRYETSEHYNPAQWEKDFPLILVALNCRDPEKLARLRARLAEAKWIQVGRIDHDDKESPIKKFLVAPSTAYVDGLEVLRYFWGKCYFLFSPLYTEAVREKLVDLGVARLPRINARPADSEGHVRLVKQRGWHERGLDGFDPDWQVDGLDAAIASPRKETSAFIWNRLLIPHFDRIRGVVEQSSRQTFENPSRKHELSHLGVRLRQAKWLPGIDGQFMAPTEMMLADLPTEFNRDSPQAQRLAEALGMKLPEASKAIDNLSRGDPRIRNLMERLARGDLDDATLDKLEKVLPRAEPVSPPPKFRDAVQSIHRQRGSNAHQATHEPAGNLQNPDRYLERRSEEIGQQRGEQPSTRVASFAVIRERNDNKEAREFLYQQYAGKCQVSGATFQMANGKNHFVAVSLVSSRDAGYLNDAGNMLCLSADMAARFMHGTFEWLDDLGQKIEAFRPAASGGSEQHRTVRVRIAGEECTIKFSEAHFLRLKSLWMVA